MIMVLVPMAPPGLVLAVVAAIAVVAIVVVVTVIARDGRRRLDGRLRDDRRRWRHDRNGRLRR
jgi:hypothetical protein